MCVCVSVSVCVCVCACLPACVHACLCVCVRACAFVSVLNNMLFGRRYLFKARAFQGDSGLKPVVVNKY